MLPPLPKKSIAFIENKKTILKTESNDDLLSIFNQTPTIQENSLQQIKESVSQFFNENFDRLAKANSISENGINNSCSLNTTNYCCPTIAASEKTDSTFSTPTNTTPTRCFTAASLKLNAKL